MDVQFQKNTIKKGDPGFQYDKRVSFNYNAEEAEDNSWDESEDEGVEIVAASQNRSKPRGLGLAAHADKVQDEFDDMDDNDYFDDDFDDDFQ